MHLSDASQRILVASELPASSWRTSSPWTQSFRTSRPCRYRRAAQRRAVCHGPAQFDPKGKVLGGPPAQRCERCANAVRTLCEQRSHSPPMTRLTRLGLLGYVTCAPTPGWLPSLLLQVSFDGHCCTSCRCLPLKHVLNLDVALDMELLAAFTGQSERGERCLSPYYFPQFQRE